MTRTARVHAVAKPVATLVGTAIPMPVLCTAALLGLAVASTRPDRGLGLPWRIATLAISIPMVCLWGRAADGQGWTVAVGISVPVIGKVVVLQSRVAPGVADRRTRSAERAGMLALVLGWLRCQGRMRPSRLYPRLRQAHRHQGQRDPLACAPKPVARWSCRPQLRYPPARWPGYQRGMRVSRPARAGHHWRFGPRIWTE